MPTTMTTSLTSWNNYPTIQASVCRPERYKDLFSIEGSQLARGLGRSYGDAALSSTGTVILTEKLNRVLEFDPVKGTLIAEAGLSLETILTFIVPRGWFLPVTPGTQYVTLGGCVAADVHGKNHHRDGSISDHLLYLDLITADGSVMRCSPAAHPDLYWATIGGMGLTGIISEVAIQLRSIESAYIACQHHAVANLEALLQVLDDRDKDDLYSVAWIDCLAKGAQLGRGVLMTGHHAKINELSASQKDPLKRPSNLQLTVPYTPSRSLVGKYSVSLFNGLYYQLQSRKTKPFITDYQSYFYPLDAIAHWNRLYGKKGFVQYQCVLPRETALEGFTQILEELRLKGNPSFLAVVKRFGPEGKGLLSFPSVGYTLAIDLPITDSTFLTHLDQLDDLVLQRGGRIYLAKDARLSPDRFRQMYPRYATWLKIKKETDPENRFHSDLAQRLRIGEA